MFQQKYDQLRKSDLNAKKLTSAQKHAKHLEATSFVMNPVIESVRPLHPMKVWEDISPQFLVTFWSLSMYDLQVPLDSYQREINKIKSMSASMVESKDVVRITEQFFIKIFSFNNISFQNSLKIKKEQERYIALIEKLQDERKKQQEHVEKILSRLAEEKDSWFLSRSAKSAKNETITQFLQLCQRC